MDSNVDTMAFQKKIRQDYFCSISAVQISEDFVACKLIDKCVDEYEPDVCCENANEFIVLRKTYDEMLSHDFSGGIRAYDNFKHAWSQLLFFSLNFFKAYRKSDFLEKIHKEDYTGREESLVQYGEITLPFTHAEEIKKNPLDYIILRADYLDDFHPFSLDLFLFDFLNNRYLNLPCPLHFYKEEWGYGFKYREVMKEVIEPLKMHMRKGEIDVYFYQDAESQIYKKAKEGDLSIESMVEDQNEYGVDSLCPLSFSLSDAIFNETIEHCPSCHLSISDYYDEDLHDKLSKIYQEMCQCLMSRFQDVGLSFLRTE